MNQNINTISLLVEEGLCTGCGTCVAICPANAITLNLDRDCGLYIPNILTDLCRNCGRCLQVCPGHEVDFTSLNQTIFGDSKPDPFLGHHMVCYTGHATEPEIRYNCASGGLITALLIFALEQGLITGALVTRMKKEAPLESEPFIARTKEEIIEASKSKYCPVSANLALKEILDADPNERFAVVGLPCHIQGIRKAEKIDRKLQKKIVLHIGIMCAHTDSFLATEFILQSQGIRPEDVTGIDYRGRGWPGSMLIQLQDGGTKELSFKEYIKPFHSYNFFTPTRCLQCFDATCEFSDISTGDAWDLRAFKEENIGESIILCRTEAGVEILSMLESSGRFSLSSIPPNDVIRSQRGLMYTKKVALPFRLFLLKAVRRKNPQYNLDLPLFRYFIPIDAILPYINSVVFRNNYLRKALTRTPKLVIHTYGSLTLCMARLWMKKWEWKNRS